MAFEPLLELAGCRSPDDNVAVVAGRDEHRPSGENPAPWTRPPPRPRSRRVPLRRSRSVTCSSVGTLTSASVRPLGDRSAARRRGRAANARRECAQPSQRGRVEHDRSSRPGSRKAGAVAETTTSSPPGRYCAHVNGAASPIGTAGTATSAGANVSSHRDRLRPLAVGKAPMRCSIESRPPVGREQALRGGAPLHRERHRGIPHRQRPHSTGRDVDERQAGPGRRLAGAIRPVRRSQTTVASVEPSGENAWSSHPASGRRIVARRSYVRASIRTKPPTLSPTKSVRPSGAPLMQVVRWATSRCRAGREVRGSRSAPTRAPRLRRARAGRRRGGCSTSRRTDGSPLPRARGGASGRASPRSARVSPAQQAVVASSSARLRARTARPPAMIASESKLATPPSNARRRRFIAAGARPRPRSQRGSPRELPLELVELRSVSSSHSGWTRASRHGAGHLDPGRRVPTRPRTSSHSAAPLARVHRPRAIHAIGAIRGRAPRARPRRRLRSRRRDARRRGRRAPRAPRRGRRRAHRWQSGVERRRRSAAVREPEQDVSRLRLAPPGRRTYTSSAIRATAPRTPLVWPYARRVSVRPSRRRRNEQRALERGRVRPADRASRRRASPRGPARAESGTLGGAVDRPAEDRPRSWGRRRTAPSPTSCEIGVRSAVTEVGANRDDDCSRLPLGSCADEAPRRTRPAPPRRSRR